jgi:trans-aconitate methyltransferase
MTSSTLCYFNNKSGKYTQSSASTFWCWQREREAAAVDLLMGPAAKQVILDLGCGTGYYTRHFLERGASHIAAVDFSLAMISGLLEANVTGIVEDATKLKMDVQFNKIICAGLLEFVDSSYDTLRTARHLIRPEGRMVCVLPPDNWAGRLYRNFHRCHGIEIRLFAQSAFEYVCRETGWSIDDYRPVFPYTEVYRLTPTPVIKS